jgi:hypothetical protein
MHKFQPLLNTVNARLKAVGVAHDAVRTGVSADGVLIFVLETGAPIWVRGRGHFAVPAGGPTLAAVAAALPGCQTDASSNTVWLDSL